MAKTTSKHEALEEMKKTANDNGMHEEKKEGKHEKGCCGSHKHHKDCCK
jgi:hypothetical protein